MNRIIFLILLVLFFLIPLLAETDLEKVFPAKKGQSLDIYLKSGGSINITGWDKSQVEVKITGLGYGVLERDINFEQNDEGLAIEAGGDSRGKGPKYTIKVPAEFDLILKTMGGSILIHKVKGDFSGKTMGGKLNLRYLKGVVNLKTMGGSIEVKDSELDGVVRTMGGRILLENVIGDIKGSSMGGSVIYKNVKRRNGKSSGKVVKISTMGGAINVDEAPDGVDAHTMGGKIIVNSARKFVKLKTMGGDIAIKKIDGRIYATTMGGDIHAKMIGDPDRGKRDVNLSSMGGDITLIVPEGLSMKVDITLEYTKNGSKKYDIISEFELKKESTKTWAVRDGNSRKYIYGTGLIAGGKNMVKIKTVNGNIYLKKEKK